MIIQGDDSGGQSSMLFGIVGAAQAIVQKCAHFCVGFFASGGISADVDAVPRIHAVRNVGSMNNVTARCIKSVMAVGIHNYLERFAARGHCLTQLDTRLRGRPIVAFPDVDASGCAGLPTIARAQRPCRRSRAHADTEAIAQPAIGDRSIRGSKAGSVLQRLARRSAPRTS